MSLLTGKRVVLGVTGSIACYKAADLASKLSQAGAEVDVILTRAAAQFVSALTFQSITGRHCFQDDDLWGAQGHVLHIGLGKEADLILVAPVTANTIAKFAQGQVDNLLTLTVLASEAALLLAPAMDGGMFAHPTTQANLESLRSRGAEIAGPASGHLASGLTGEGRMLEPAELVGHVRRFLGKSGSLAGRKVVVTAGGSQEAIDPVRVIANRSSGKQGYALAQAAIDLGAEVTLISGPSALSAPIGAELIDVESAKEMLDAVLKATKEADALLMAAAVADFRPKEAARQKIKRAGGAPTIELIPNPDILGEVSERGRPRVVVGFAAESEDLRGNARAKLEDKQVDLIVANDISTPDSGFEVDTNRVLLVAKDGKVDELPLLSKEEVAQKVLERVVDLLS